MVVDAKPDFGKIRFKGKLRPSQVDSSTIVSEQLNKDDKNLLIVAPPGSGKTVLGLYIWSDLVRLPALVLSPNSAIQAQWIARAKELFELDGKDQNIGTSSKKDSLLTSLTYQSLTLPKKNDHNLDDAAMAIWIEKLISDGEASNHEIAKAWISDLQEHNLQYYKERLGIYRKRVRDDYASKGNALWILHDSAKEKLELLRLSLIHI